MSNATPAFRKIGKYEIQSEVGRGGFGRVYKALDPDVKRLVAIKILAAPPDDDLRARFQFEAAAAGNLRHKNIVTIYDFGEFEQKPFLVMEYLEGQTLQEVIASHQTLSILQEMTVMSQVADGLQCAHINGVVHRDVKPANIMVLPDGAVKIMDFGIARATRQDATRLTQAGFMLGTLRYMAPEQFENIEAGVLGDIFAYGVVYYEFLTGTHPFDAPDAASIMFKITRADPPPLRQSVPDCPDALERILGRAMAKDRNVRYQSLEELQFDAEPLWVGLRRKRAEELLQQANSRIGGDQPESAVALIRELLELDPSNHEALLLRSSLQQQVHQRAVKSKIDALVKDGNDLIAQAKLAEAIRSFQSAVRLNAHDTEAQWALNRALAMQQARERAAQLIEEARLAQRNEDWAGALRKASEASHVDSQSLEARSLLETIRKEVDRRESQNRRKLQLEKAEGLLLVKEFDEALEVLDAVAAGGPGREEVAELRARVLKERSAAERQRHFAEEMRTTRKLIKERRFDEAVQQLESLEPEYKGEEELRNLLRHAREQRRLRDRADTVQAITTEVESLCSSGGFEQAVATLEKGLQSLPGDPELLELLERTLVVKAGADRQAAIQVEVQRAQELRQTGRFLEAIQVLDAALRTLGDSPVITDLHHALQTEWEAQRRADAVRKVVEEARDLIETGRPGSAAFRLKNAAAQFPGEPVIGELLQVADEKVRAQQRAQSIQALSNEVRILVAARNFEAALQQLADGLNRFPDDPSLLALRASVESGKAAYERDKKLEEGVVRCVQLRQEHRFEDAFREVAQLLAKHGNQERLLNLRDQIQRDLDAQKKFEDSQAVAGQARELIRQDRPEQAIQLARQSGIDPDLNPELAALLKTAEGAIATRQKGESLRRIVARAAQFEQDGDLRQARQTLEDGLKQFPDSAELAEGAVRLRTMAAGQARQQELARQCALIEKTIAAGDWAIALQLVESCAGNYGPDARLTDLRERALRIKSQLEDDERRSIAEVLRAAQEREARGDLSSALAIAEKGLRLHPASSEIAEALARLNETIRRQDLAKKTGERVIEVERQIAAGNWTEAARLLIAARQALGSQPVFDRLYQQIQTGEAARAAEDRSRIQEICDRAWSLVQNQQIAAALESIEDGLKLYPDSLELAQARAAIAPQMTARKRQQKIAEQIAAVERSLSENDPSRAVALAEAGHREFPDQPAFVVLIERSRTELRSQALELVVSKVKAALAAGALETARSLLVPALQHFQNEAALAQLSNEIDLEQSRRDKLANAREALQKGRFDAAEKLCRELLSIRPNDADAIATLEQVSIRRTEINRGQAERRSRRAQQPALWKRWQFVTAGSLVAAGLITFAVVHRPEPPKPPPPLAKPEPAKPVAEPKPVRQETPPVQKPTVTHEEKPKPRTPPHEFPAAHPPTVPPVAVTHGGEKPSGAGVPQPPPAVKPCVSDFDENEYGAARSGTIEWSGPPGKVRISGRTPSAGNIRGGLPGVPIKVQAPQGATIVEPPSCQNNWTLVFDANDVSVPLKFTWHVYQP